MQIGCDVEERLEHEGSAMHAWMRKGQRGRFEFEVVHQQQVEIQGAWRVGVRAISSGLTLDALQDGEEIGGRQGRLDLDDRIEEIGPLSVHGRAAVEA